MADAKRRAVELEPMPDAADLRAALSHGMSYVTWCAAGKPAQRAAIKSPASYKIAGVRPWHPYRSKWEADYAGYLRAVEQVRLIAGWEYEPERLEIGAGAFYTPDFRITRVDGSREWREVKGYRREAAMVRLKVAAQRYPETPFVLVTKANGQWKHTTIGAKP